MACVAALAASGEALAGELRLEPTSEGFRVVLPGGEAASEVKVGPTRELLRFRDVVYAALEDGGVEVVSLATPTRPERMGRIASGVRAARLVLSGGTLYVLETQHRAYPFDLGDPGHPRAESAVGLAPSRREGAIEAQPAPAPVVVQAPAEVGAPQAEVRVRGVTKGRVLFDGGSEAGLKDGVRVRIISQRLVEVPDLSTGGTRQVASGETTAVVQVEHAEAKQSMARLGRGDVAEPGDLVVVTTEELSERLFLPRRAPFTVRWGFHVRPFLGLEVSTQAGSSKPFGVLADLYGAYYFEKAPVRIDVSASPIAFAVGANDRHYPMTFAATGAYTTDYFEIGLGVGALVGNAGPCPPYGPDSCEVNTGFTINQVLRLGALDGLHASWRSSVFSRREAFTFGMGRGELNVPLSSRLGLFGAGGGGENGWAFGELGVRTYIGGAGARGTLIISASLGVTAIMDGPTHESVAGPAVAFGSEWRY